MTKEELIHLSNNLYDQALKARAYFEVIKQYQINKVSHTEQLNISPAFYQITYSALNDALIMILAKLYDINNNSLKLDTLIDECKNGTIFKELFYTAKKQYDEDLLINYTVSEDDTCFFADKIEKSKNTCQRLGIPYTQATLQLSLDEYFDFVSQKKESLSSIRQSLRNLRNKVFAHNDKLINFDYNEVLKNNGLDCKQVENLIKFALDFSGFCYTSLTSECIAENYLDIDDWNQTLYYSELGQKYENLI